MIRAVSAAAMLAALSAHALAEPAALPLNPDSGPFAGEGVLNDHDGNSGVWRITARLSGGKIAGGGMVAIAGATLTLPLNPDRSYFENGRCNFLFESGRTHLNFSGNCTAGGIEGRWDGFIAENQVNSRTGEMKAAFRFGAGAADTPPAAGVLPTAKLTCAWMERVGGNVGGQDYHYELRYSNMGVLQLSSAGTYRTASSGGTFIREGNMIRLASGAFAGAVGRLEPDKSGQPAVYFEREENKRPNGVPIVDPARTSCTVARGG